MKNRHRVVWTKGMFLNPQHFQTQDQYFEDATDFRFSASNYANWGVTSLDIDHEALAGGVFTLNQARGIMPDGLIFRMPDGDDLPPSRDIEGFFPPAEREVEVYLAIPDHRADAANVTIPAAAADGVSDTRYTAKTLMVTDVNAGREEKPVQVAQRNFRLLFGSENRDSFSTLCVAQIVRNPQGLFQVKRTHIAPCLDIAHNKYLMGLLQTILGILANKSANLSAGRRERGKSVADFTASETTNFWLLHTVNTTLPELRHIWKVRHGHPEQAYLVLSRLAGALATFSLDASPDELPGYNHKDLGTCFSLLDAQIRRLVETVIVEPYETVPLVLGDRDIWTGTITDDRHFRDSQFFLAVSAAMEAGEIIQKVPLRMKVAAVEDIDLQINKALPGIRLTHTPAPPVIRMKLSNQYFMLGQQGSPWQKVKESRNIAVFVPPDIKQPKLELVIVKSKQA